MNSNEGASSILDKMVGDPKLKRHLIEAEKRVPKLFSNLNSNPEK